MSETDDLKAETKKSAAMQQLKDVNAYLDVLIEKVHDTHYWSMRGDMLEAFAFFGYFVILTTGLFMNAPDSILSIHANLAWIVVLVAMFRSWNLNRDWAKALSEVDGALNILRLLGMMPKSRPRGEREKKHVWSEGADIVKGWFKSKKEAQEKVYAPA